MQIIPVLSPESFGLHVHELRPKWLTMAAVDTQDMGIGYGGFLYVCVSFLAATGLTG